MGLAAMVAAWILYLGAGAAAILMAVRRATEDCRASAFAWAALVVGLSYLAGWLVAIRAESQVLLSILGYGVLLGPMLMLASIGAGIVAVLRGERPAGRALIPVGLSVLLIVLLTVIMTMLQRAL